MKRVYVLQSFIKDKNGELPHIGSVIGVYTSKEALLEYFPKYRKITDEFGTIVGRKDVMEHGIYNNAIIKEISNGWSDGIINIPETSRYFHITETFLNRK